jgi:hypothetical protein
MDDAGSEWATASSASEALATSVAGASGGRVKRE